MQQYMNIRKKINIPKRVIVVSLVNFEILLYNQKENERKTNVKVWKAYTVTTHTELISCIIFFFSFFFF